MNNHLHKRIFTAAITLLLTTAYAAFADKFEECKDYSFALSGAGKLVVDVSDADIRIRGEQGLETAQIVVTKTAKKMNEEEAQEAFDLHIIECTQEGDLVRIKSIRPDHSLMREFNRLGRHVNIDIEVLFPKDAEVIAKTSDGDIALETINGECSLRTSDGNVLVSDIRGTLSAKTSDGDVVISGVRGDVEMTTSDGDLAITNVEGDIDLKTSDGDISIGQLKGSLQAKTSDGDISATMQESPLSDCRLITSDGDVELTLADNVSVNLDVRLSDGEINISHPFANITKLTKRSGSGQINQGGKNVSIVTADGDISIHN